MSVSRRSGLGRGLDALIPGTGGGDDPVPSDQVETDSTSELGRVLAVAVDSIRPNTYQPRVRFDQESLDGLAESIREVGVLQPLLVRTAADGGFELIAGERRWRAAQLAGLATVPVIVRPVDDSDSLEQAIVENLHREDLNPLEEAAAFRQLIDEFAYTQEQVAQRVGKSRPAVANHLRLLQLPGEIQTWVRDGQLSAGHARAILSVSDEGSRVSFARGIMSNGWSVRQAEEHARTRQNPDRSSGTTTSKSARPPSAVPVDRPAGVLELEELLSDRLDTRVGVELTAKHGRIIIEFADLDDLERIYRALVDE